MKWPLLAASIAAIAAVVAAPHARAFSPDTPSSDTTGGYSRLADPDDRLEREADPTNRSGSLEFYGNRNSSNRGTSAFDTPFGPAATSRQVGGSYRNGTFRSGH